MANRKTTFGELVILDPPCTWKQLASAQPMTWKAYTDARKEYDSKVATDDPNIYGWLLDVINKGMRIQHDTHSTYVGKPTRRLKLYYQRSLDIRAGLIQAPSPAAVRQKGAPQNRKRPAGKPLTDGDSEEEIDADAWAQQGGGEQGGPSRQNSSQVARNDARARAARLAASGPSGTLGMREESAAVGLMKMQQLGQEGDGGRVAQLLKLGKSLGEDFTLSLLTEVDCRISAVLSSRITAALPLPKELARTRRAIARRDATITRLAQHQLDVSECCAHIRSAACAANTAVVALRSQLQSVGVDPVCDAMPEPPQLPPLPPPTPNEDEIQEAEVETEEEEEQPVSGEDVAMGSAQGGTGDGSGEDQGTAFPPELFESRAHVKQEDGSWPQEEHQPQQRQASRPHHAPGSSTPGVAMVFASAAAADEHLTPLSSGQVLDLGLEAAAAPCSGGSSAGTTSHADRTAFASAIQQQLPFSFTHTPHQQQQQQHAKDPTQTAAASPSHGVDVAAVQERLSSAGTFKRATDCCGGRSAKPAGGHAPPPHTSSKPSKPKLSHANSELSRTNLQLLHPVVAQEPTGGEKDEDNGSHQASEQAAAEQNSDSSGALTNSAYSARTTASDVHHQQPRSSSGAMPLVAA